ncbi:MAG: DUF309 domain-containing protein [Notoacmeibacter sp.]|nr:DUF309 domain-containing protein [Notoacmeibacter sp.]MCC0033239.1 DUF309 domain-containing protein [Brucellaceae bacterium]
MTGGAGALVQALLARVPQPLRAAIDAALDDGLPEQPYQPGRTERPHAGIVFDLSARARSVPSVMSAENEALAAGLCLIHRGWFWEAHEVLEALWQGLPMNSAERHVVQALIQHANARLKQEAGQARAAARLDAIAQDHLDEAQARGWKPDSIHDC